MSDNGQVSLRINEIFDAYIYGKKEGYISFLNTLKESNVSTSEIFELENTLITIAKGAAEHAYYAGISDILNNNPKRYPCPLCPHFDHTDIENFAHITYKSR